MWELSLGIKCMSSLNLSLIRGKVLYNVVLVSALNQHESAIGIHMSSHPLYLSPTTHSSILGLPWWLRG